MRKLVYRDLDEFASSLDGIEGHFVPTSRQTAEWWIQRSDGRCNWLQAFQTGSPATFAGQGKSDTVTVAAPITQLGEVRVNGDVLGPDEFVVLHADQPFTFTSQNVVCWAGFTIPKLALLIPAEVVPKRSSNGPRIRAEPTHLDRLRRMVSRTLNHLERVDFTEPGIAAALEQELAVCLTTLLECSSTPSRPRRVTRPQFPRNRVIAHTLALIEARQGEPLFIRDLCRAAEVSERTLRNIYRDYFGVGPIRLLKAIQLQNIRMALLRADPHEDKVTHIAAEHGVWDFSLFARNYKAMFGETPSLALHTPTAAVRSKRSKFSWLHYAARIVMDDRS
ncbi:MAG TPA: helix-turn-helix domain-containing protein [Steroidobacter sp.]|uniref:helix-turn-helix domain-containing protein n=1 Tax=Steroidobacter sp. TaxID=1978227 RepID=UPI002EDB09E4